MKKAALILCVMFMFTNAMAANTDVVMDTRVMTLEKTPVNKLIRGFVNSLTFLIEIPASICDVAKRKGGLAGATIGVADGFFTSFVRLGTGLFDAVTFLIPPYNKPLLKPEYAIDSAVDKMGLNSADW